MPRRAGRRPSRRNARLKDDAPQEENNIDALLPMAASMTSFRHGHDVFRDDDDAISGMTLDEAWPEAANNLRNS